MAGFAPPTKRSGARKELPARSFGAGPDHHPIGQQTFFAPFTSEPAWAPFRPRGWFGGGVQRRAAPDTKAGRASPLRGSSLVVSDPADAAEREAEAVANRIVDAGAPAAPVRPASGPSASGVQRACASCEQEQEKEKEGEEPAMSGSVHRRAEAGATPNARGADVASAIGGGGSPLPQADRGFFEQRLGHDLSGVRLHTSERASAAARDLRAAAFTVGSDIAFARSRYTPGTREGRHLLAHELVHVVQQGAAQPLTNAAGGAVEAVSSTIPGIARRMHDAPPTSGTPPMAEPAATAAAMPGGSAAPGGLIVEDDAATLTSGQMRKSAFLTELRTTACAAADRELARAGRDTRGCPVVERLLDRYGQRPAAHLERAVRKLAPAAASAISAEAYIPLVAERMARGVRTWVETGRMPADIPPEVQAEMAGGDTGGGLGGAVSSVVGAIGGAISAVGRLFFQAGPGGARPGTDRQALAARLGEGRPLGGSERRRMESAFGESFSGVRVHADSGAAGLARDLGARAFTLGEHVAFSEGAYQPGSPVGDAILAHELAHVVQQKGSGRAELGPSRGRGGRRLGRAGRADHAAGAVMTALYAGGSPAEAGKPRMRGGLRLSRCATNKVPAAASPTAAPSATTAPLTSWDLTVFQAKLADPSQTTDALADEIAALNESERDKAAKGLSGERVRLQRELDSYKDQVANASPAARPALVASLKPLAKAVDDKLHRIDEILQIGFRDVGVAEKPAAGLAAVAGKTHVPDAAERGKIAQALKPDPQPTPAGTTSTFQRQIPGEAQKYDDKIKAVVPGMVDGYWNQMVAGKGPAEHADPTKVHALTEFEPIAAAAKDATDAVFGSPSPPRAPYRANLPGRGGNLHDLFADTTDRLAATGPAGRREQAKQLLFYFFQSDPRIATINRRHSAAPAFNPSTSAPSNTEAKVLNDIANTFVASMANVKKLNEIDRNWDASADPAKRTVNLQIFKQATPQKDREFLWDMYQTLIHEYIHTLAHPKFVAFADRFGPTPENNTLIEGVDSFLTEIVWSEAKKHTADPALRAKIEGPAFSGAPFDASVIPPIYNRRYASYIQAVKLVNTVGIQNLYAAYFQGKVDLIKPKP